MYLSPISSRSHSSRHARYTRSGNDPAECTAGPPSSPPRSSWRYHGTSWGRLCSLSPGTGPVICRLIELDMPISYLASFSLSTTPRSVKPLRAWLQTLRLQQSYSDSYSRSCLPCESIPSVALDVHTDRFISNGIVQPYRELGWWKWMFVISLTEIQHTNMHSRYWLSPYTYLVEGVVGEGIILISDLSTTQTKLVHNSRWAAADTMLGH